MTRLVLLATAAVLACGTARAGNITFATLDNPGDPTFNQLLGINNKGEISGYFGSGMAVGHPNIGYTIKPPYNTFVPLNVPGSVQTQPIGLNGVSTVVGFWSNTNLGAGDANFGFVRTLVGSSYNFVTVTDPAGRNANPPVTQLLGINGANQAVGFYNDANNVAHGFELSIATGRFTAVQPAGTTASTAAAINKNNLVAGFAVDQHKVTFAFEKQMPSGAVVKFQVPGATVTQFFGVNDIGTAVGSYTDANNIMHGIIYQSKTNTYQQVDAPSGVLGTVLNGVNDAGQAVGFYMDAAGNTHGLLVWGVPKS